LTAYGSVEYNELVRVAARFFSGVPHPHLLGVCCPNFYFRDFTRLFEPVGLGIFFLFFLFLLGCA
jgi:hypothetical protein